MVSTDNTRTLRPIVTGSSVLAIKYKDGVLLCCDTKASYGNMCRYVDVPRISKISSTTAFACSGEYSDYQFIADYLSRVHTRDWLSTDHDDYATKPSEYASILSRLTYAKRCKFNPLWASAVVAGVDGGKSYLGYVDMYGTIYEESYMATGLGRYFGLTLLRDQHKPDMTEQAARELLEQCMRILFYRDTLASNRIQIGRITKEGVTIDAPKTLDSKWDYSGWTDPSTNLSLAACSW
eukprot:GHVS01033864.1.p1 GENE.GHVS01033864.1~~GHVS01033864.1.p1  ORF type:complete len:237 (+),score=15.67 GHVS01033864.1:139-849(+)